MSFRYKIVFWLFCKLRIFSIKIVSWAFSVLEVRQRERKVREKANKRNYFYSITNKRCILQMLQLVVIHVTYQDTRSQTVSYGAEPNPSLLLWVRWKPAKRLVLISTLHHWNPPSERRTSPALGEKQSSSPFSALMDNKPGCHDNLCSKQPSTVPSCRNLGFRTAAVPDADKIQTSSLQEKKRKHVNNFRQSNCGKC